MIESNLHLPVQPSPNLFSEEGSLELDNSGIGATLPENEELESGSLCGPLLTCEELASQTTSEEPSAQELPEKNQRLAILEAILFASAVPIKINELRQVCPWPAATIIEDLQSLALKIQGSGLELQRVAKAWRLVTAPSVSAWVEKFLKIHNRQSLTKAQMETLAVIAYRQPVTRAEIEAYRGVKAERILKQLEELNLIREVGRAPVPGRPSQFGTTSDFLRYFSLDKIEELPSISQGQLSLKKVRSSPTTAKEGQVSKVALTSPLNQEESSATETFDEDESLENISGPSLSLQKLFAKIKGQRSS